MKWFQFVSKIKKETGVKSLKEAMKIASERKSEWKKDGSASPASSKKTGKKRGTAKKGRGKGTRRMRGGKQVEVESMANPNKMTGGKKSESDADMESESGSKMTGGRKSDADVETESVSKMTGGETDMETDAAIKSISKLKW
jgi:hypothetical protein